MKIRKKLKENYDEATKEFTEITGNQNGVQQTVEKFKQLINRDAFPENQQDINFWRMRGWKQFKAAVDTASKAVEARDSKSSANPSSDTAQLKQLIDAYPMNHAEIQKQLVATNDQELSFTYMLRCTFNQKKVSQPKIIENAIKYVISKDSINDMHKLAKSIDFANMPSTNLLYVAKTYPQFIKAATNFLTPEQQASIKKTDDTKDANDTANTDDTKDASSTANTDNAEFYIYDNNETQGPFSKYDLASRLRSNKLDATTLVQKAGSNKWVEADEVTELAKFVNKDDSATADTETDTTEESESNYYVYNNDTQEGPYSTSEIVSKIQSNEFDADVFVWKDGLPEWIEANQDDELSSKLNIDSSDADYYVSIKNNAEGPMTNDDVVSLLSSSKITEKSLVWSPDLDGWTPFSDVDDLTKKANEREYVAWVDDKSSAPMMIDEVAKNIKKKLFKSTTLVWREGLKKWTPIQSVRELKKLLRK